MLNFYNMTYTKPTVNLLRYVTFMVGVPMKAEKCGCHFSADVIYPSTEKNNISNQVSMTTITQPNEYTIGPDGSQTYLKIDGIEEYLKTPDNRQFCARNANGVEFYAQKNGIDYYPRDEHDNEFYARDKTGGEFYAKDEENSDVYARDNTESEIYAVNASNEQFYATDAKGRQFYARDNDDNELYLSQHGYAKDEHQHPYYARKNTQSEYYYRYNNTDVPVIINRLAVYATDAHNNEFYPETNGSEYVLYYEGGKHRFATRHDGSLVVPRNENRDEYLPENLTDNDILKEIGYLRKKDGSLRYPTDAFGNEIYRRDENDKVIYIKDSYSNEVYAKKFNENREFNEYYPENDDFALDSEGKPRYAVDWKDDIIYPKDGSSNEFYLQQEEGVDYLPFRSDRYAKFWDGRERYPTDHAYDSSYERFEEGLGYARDEHNKLYYPMDANGNEMYFEADEIPDTYPISFKSTIILPESRAGIEPILLTDIPADVTVKDAKKKIFRPHLNDYKDYYTDIESKFRKTRYIIPPSKVTIQKKKKKKNQINIMFLLISILIMILSIIGLFKFFNKN